MHMGIIKFRDAGVVSQKGCLEYVDKLGYLFNVNWNIGFQLKMPKL